MIENDGEYYPYESIGEQIAFIFWLFFGVTIGVCSILAIAI